MKTIELIGHVDEQHRLYVDVPTNVPPGPVRIILEVGEVEEEDEEAWANAISQAWAADWSDSREDIYTIGGREAEGTD